MLSREVGALVIFYGIGVISSHYTDSPLRDKYDGYGDDWIFMPDGNGHPQVAVLKGQGPEFRGLIDESVNYHLYTRNGPPNGTMLFNGNLDLIKNSGFSPWNPTKFITHGWKSSAFSASLLNLKDAYLRRGDYNVILVDWEPLASSTFYLGPMQNTGKVGKQAGLFIDFLIQETGIRSVDIHFIGHSLGAHVAGNAAASTTHGKLGRVTGLDPALPGFHVITSNDGKLDSSDADFVDVIHSCGGILGFLQPVGHADFYPNGGVAVQPGCCCLPEITEACSHGRAYVYFTESIFSDAGLLATKCDTWDQFRIGACSNSAMVFMGEPVDHAARGNYFLKTRAEAPFADSPKKSLPSGISETDCDEPGGWQIEDGLRVCGTNSV
ncbi:phospholipase A1-like [Fopius arisanus]|uniref:phospholipase A1 n=1 Tax=Fopius arisanus TaxID=64838 RepID=A0A9R1U5D6_9HYME|nr:PREDICTED: phospholipase A1-like [Fopius arisanus]